MTIVKFILGLLIGKGTAAPVVSANVATWVAVLGFATWGLNHWHDKLTFEMTMGAAVLVVLVVQFVVSSVLTVVGRLVPPAPSVAAELKEPMPWDRR